jgi:seryl-tRNA synthetase
MLSLDFICQHPDIVRHALRKRRDGRNISDILHLAEQRRELITRSDGLYATLRKLKENTRSLPLEMRQTPNVQIKALTEEIRQLELRGSDIGTRLHLLLLNLPNIPHASVKEQDDATIGEEVRRWGEPFHLHAEEWCEGRREQVCHSQRRRSQTGTGTYLFYAGYTYT